MLPCEFTGRPQYPYQLLPSYDIPSNFSPCLFSTNPPRIDHRFFRIEEFIPNDHGEPTDPFEWRGLMYAPVHTFHRECMFKAFKDHRILSRPYPLSFSTTSVFVRPDTSRCIRYNAITIKANAIIPSDCFHFASVCWLRLLPDGHCALHLCLHDENDIEDDMIPWDGDGHPCIAIKEHHVLVSRLRALNKYK